MRLSFAIMHAAWVEWRRENLRLLREALPDAHIAADTGHEGVWPTAWRAWSMRPKDSTHHVVLQDDVVLCDGFRDVLTAAVEAMPAPIISLFTMHKDVQDAGLRNNSAWVSTPSVYGTGCLMPSMIAERFLRWSDRETWYQYPHDDVRIRAFAKLASYPIVQTVPCLIDHLGATRSLTGEDHPSRVAPYWPPGPEVYREGYWTPHPPLPAVMKRYPLKRDLDAMLHG